MMATQASNMIDVGEEDALRAHMYRFLAHFLAHPPGAQELGLAAGMEGDESDLGRAIKAFSTIAAKATVEGAEQEYNDLFIGVGRGELLPYASYYLTGFLHEKPLAKLRTDMSRLGIEREETLNEPEDHVAALFEMMGGLITGEFGEAASLDEQKDFFDSHVGSWTRHFFRDLEGAKSSVLYAALGSIGRVFMEIEEIAFSMD